MVAIKSSTTPRLQSFFADPRKGSWWGKKVLVRYALFAILGFSFGRISSESEDTFILWWTNTGAPDMIDSHHSAPTIIEKSDTVSWSEIKRPICPQTRHLLRVDDDMASLTSAYLEAEKFHYGGGNMKTIEKYLNAQTDKTYEMLNIKFKPKGSDGFLRKTESITQKVHELYKANDVHKRGGYDQRKPPGQWETSNTKYFTKRKDYLDVIEPFNHDRWEAGLGPKFEVCKKMDTIENKKNTYENKFMCSFEELRTDVDNAGEEEVEEQCEMISIGSNGQWGFEETIAKVTNCTTHTFDCTTVGNPRKPDIDSIRFYPYCVSATNMKVEDREYMTYSKIVEQTGMTQAPALFKMDVEGFEFDVMAQMLDEAVTSGTTYLLPSQISVELHYGTRMFDIPWRLRLLQGSEIAMFMGMMYSRGGYVPVNIHLDPGCFPCAELLFLRLFCD